MQPQPPAQLAAFRSICEETCAPLQADLMSLRKQVVQLQLQIAQGFQQQHRDNAALVCCTASFKRMCICTDVSGIKVPYLRH